MKPWVPSIIPIHLLPYTDTTQTSALDTHTEQALLSHINSLVKEKKRTSVFVAHRLRTIYDSDVIIVLREGGVAESGTHQDLIDRDGLYSELWSAQETMFAEPEKEGKDAVDVKGEVKK
jgi:ATP-binding cassette subfamily B (MDR/TAP) protein 7